MKDHFTEKKSKFHQNCAKYATVVGYNSPENQDVRGRLKVNSTGGSRILEGGSLLGLGTEVPQRDSGTNPERGFDNIVRRSWLYFCKLY